MPTHTKFKGVTNIGDSLASDQIQTNLKFWLDWAFLEIGGFSNVSVAQSGVYGGDYSRLRLSEDPNYEQGSVWEGFRMDWVWESGIEYSHQPMRVSGIFIDNVYSPANGAVYRVDYPLGRIIFDTPISTSSVVKCGFSHRYCHVATEDVPWWRQIQVNSYRVDSDDFLNQGSGAWSMMGQSRVQLPAVVIEVTPSTKRRPFEIGNLTQTVSQKVLFHIMAETPWERRQIHDVLTAQEEKRLIMFNKNEAFASGVYPLDEYGSPSASGLMYPDLIKGNAQGGYGWRQLRLASVESVSQTALAPLYFCTVEATCEVELP
jgi:hypothetical protein